MTHRLVTPPRLVASALCCALGVSVVSGAAAVEQKRSYDLPSGDAATTLNQFAGASGQQIIFMMDKVKGERTNAVAGDYAARDALDRMLAGTGLSATRDPATGAFVVSRKPQKGEVGPVSDQQPKPNVKTMKTKSTGLFTAILALLAAPTLPAQTASTAPGEPKGNVVALPTFTVSTERGNKFAARDSISATRVQAALLDTPQSIGVVTRDLLDDIGPTRIADAMKYIAGVSEGTSAFFGDRVSLRGFQTSSRVVDGFLFPAQANQDAATVERIEVLKGPNAVLAPTGLPGGTVNIVSKVPQFKTGGSVTATIGSFDAQRVEYDFTGAVPGTGEKFAYRVIGVLQETDLYWNKMEKKVQLLSPSILWRPFQGTEVTARYEYSDSHATAEPSVIIDPSSGPNNDAKVLAGTPRDAYYGEPSALRGTRSQLTTLFLSQELTKNIRMRLTGRYIDAEDSSNIPSGNNVNSQFGAVNPRTGLWEPGTVFGGAPDFLPSPAVALDRTSLRRTGNWTLVDYTHLGFQNDYVALFDFNGITSQTVAGWAYNDNHTDILTVQESLPNQNIDQPVYGSPITAGATTTNLLQLQDNNQFYVVERVGLLSDSLFLSAGVTRFEVHAGSVSRLALPPAVTPKSSLAKTTYLAGAVYKFRKDLSGYWGYSENASTVTPNPGLPLVWQTGKQHEFGVKSEFLNGRFSATLAYFEITLANFTFPNPDRISNPAAPANLLVDLEGHGTELEVGGGITDNLSIFGSFVDLKLRDPAGRKQRGIADRTASMFANYRWTDGPLKGFAANVGIVYTGSRVGDAQSGFTALRVPIQPSFVIPDYTVVNAGASYAFDRYVLRLFVDNLLDEDYILTPGSRTNVNRASGINVRAQATMKF
jgi:iron complex outermembrane receptor protein